MLKMALKCVFLEEFWTYEQLKSKYSRGSFSWRQIGGRVVEMGGEQADKRAFAEDRRRKRKCPPTFRCGGLEKLQRAKQRIEDAGRGAKRRGKRISQHATDSQSN
jgi:hypothetical protein